MSVCFKTPYETAAEATSAMHTTLKRRGHSSDKHTTGLKVSAYKCKTCGMYHWGHYGTKRTPKRK